MCGITGFIDYSFSSNEYILDVMRDSLSHRGPNSFGSLFRVNPEFQIGLAHRRLSIIDLSNCADQPMTDHTNNYAIVFNGEIYNFNEIKSELQKEGYEFKSSSDTEVVLNSYIHWGVKAVEKFIGMFAFVIYDKANNKVLFCRDRVGVKPLYYTISSEIILFGSELKSIIAHPSFKRKLNLSSLGLFFRRGWIPAPHTIFDSTYKLKPGHYLELDLSTRQTQEISYWNAHDYYNMDELPLSYDESKEQLHGLLKSACEYRMVADTEVGIFLSGGFDSSLVTAILQSNRTKKINTFSIGFEDEEFDEAPFARTIANYLGTNHHETICTGRDALELIPKLPFYYDEPFADSSAIPTMMVSKLASSKVKVALSGDGGDEVFGGYPRYYNKLDDFNKIQSLPAFARKSLSSLLGLPIYLLKSRNPQYLIRLEKLKKSLNYKSLAGIYRYRSEPINFSDIEIKRLLRQKEINLSAKSFYDNLILRDSLSPAMLMMAVEYKTTLPDDLLVKVDRASMAYSLEAREPLLDHRLLEFSARLNGDYHYKNAKTKSLLREICYEYIPAKIMDRPKKGFAIPMDSWLRRELKEMIMDLTSIEFIKKQNIFSQVACEQMARNYYEGSDKNGERLWSYLMFQLWYSSWMA